MKFAKNSEPNRMNRPTRQVNRLLITRRSVPDCFNEAKECRLLLTEQSHICAGS